jgi:UDP-GlcNAc:undecaprenyl-phosphate/decaprenyl-phosphate GlcNAc-1-phosphate transferase
MLYLFPFLTSFFTTVGIIILILVLCSKFDIFKRIKNSQKYSSKICRFGGLAIILGFLATIFLDKNLFISQNLWGIIAASFFILIFGIHDDFLELDWKTQFLFQVSVAILIFILGTRVEFITNPFGGMLFLNTGKYLIPGVIFVIFWFVLMINSMNWIDGIDGLSGGVALIGALTIFFLSLKPEVNQPPVGIISMALSGAILGFLIFNFYPSKIFAGTSGSMFMGFMLGALAIFAGTKIATALLIMSVPVIDAFWVIGERIKSGSSIFKSDRRHIHHKLMELGWSSRKIALLFYGTTICIAAVAVNTRALGKTITFILVSVIMILTLIYINKKLKKLENKENGLAQN